MPKLKTKSGAAKRFTKRPGGTIKFNKSNRRHLLLAKSTKVKRHSRKIGLIDKADVKSISRMLPHS